MSSVEEILACLDGAFQALKSVPSVDELFEPSSFPETIEWKEMLEKETALTADFCERYAAAIPFLSADGVSLLVYQFIRHAILDPNSEVSDYLISTIHSPSILPTLYGKLSGRQKAALSSAFGLLAERYSPKTNYRTKAAEIERRFQNK